MSRKPIELPPAIAQAFVKDMRAFFAEPDAIKRDEIAARQLYALRPYNPPRAKKMRLADVYEMFNRMKLPQMTVAIRRLVEIGLRAKK